MDFVILKVNGIDVSSYPHEDAVRTFLTAQEPIVVEVKRRVADEFPTPAPGQTSGENNSTSTQISPKLVSTGVQTEFSDLAWIDDSTLECFSHDIDLEEVTLRKYNSDEKLGLTVCYSSGSEADTCTEVYIRDIAPQSVADRDGRLRQGDQILQVNGKDVANREETELLFAENRKAVTLLVSRCYNKSEEYLDADIINDPTKNSGYQNCLIEQVVQQQNELSLKSDIPPSVPPHLIQDKLNLTNSLVRSKMDSINQEISELNSRMQNIQLLKGNKRKPPQFPDIPAPPGCDVEHIYETISESADSELEPIYSCPYENSDDNIVEQWLSKQSSDWKAQTNKTQTKDKKNKEKSRSKSSKSNSSGEEHENSSSAYNTGGSCNSNPLTFELGPGNQDELYKSTLILCPFPKTPNFDITPDTTKQTKLKNKAKVNSPHSPKAAPILSDTMYTNVANLQQTILLQQQMFMEALGQNNIEIHNKPTTSITSSSLDQCEKHNERTSTESPAMEWKVKRRPDGTRYIARRPVRNRILKNREIKIIEERGGLTTEDDTISELKVGRYWTKDERKKHLEKSRERKQRQEIIQASRYLEENNEFIFQKYDKSNYLINKKAVNNIDNTVKKHKSIKKKEVYDNIATVQEVLTHGAKIGPSQNNKITGLLSVTTV